MERAYSVLFVVYIFSTALTALLAVYAFSFKKHQVSLSFSVLMALVSVWALTVAFGIVSSTASIAWIIITIRMVVVICVPVSWVVFVLNFTDRRDWIYKRITNLVFSISILSIILIITNGLHGFFVEDIEFQQYGTFLIEEKWHLGFYYWFHVSYSYILIFFGMVLILQKAIQLKDTYRKQAAALLMGTVVPLIGNIILVFDLFPGTKVNYDVLGFVISGVAFLWAIYYQELFELKPIARQILVDHMTEGMLVINNDLRIVDINPAASKILGLEDIPLIGKKAEGLLPDDIDFSDLLHEEGIKHNVWVKDAGDQWEEFYSLAVSPIKINKQMLGHLITFNDVSEQTRLSRQMQHLAITDALTGIYNHRHFYELIQVEHERSVRKEKTLSIIIFDIDDFKKVNDTYGHLIGDQVLKEVARICKAEIRTYDTIARYGGEEFVIILPETQAGEANQMAERIRELVAGNRFETTVGEIKITISLGVSTMSAGQPETIEELIHRADSYLYQSKEQGKNRTTAD